MRTILMFLICGFGSPQPFAGGAALAIDVPNGITDGNGSSSAPFTIPMPESMRYQQVYSSSAFSFLPRGGGWITELRFRADEMLGHGFGSVSNIQVDLSTTQRTPDDLSTVFSENVGSDDTVVFGPRGLTVFGSSRIFSTSIVLSTPFFYDPTLGNLLLDVRNYSGASYLAGGQYFELDTEHTPGDSVSAVLAFGANSTSGSAFTVGLLTQFIITPIPRLAVSLMSSNLLFRWVNCPGGMLLEQSPVIGPGSFWESAGGVVTTNGIYKEVTLPLDTNTAARFFRLVLPPSGGMLFFSVGDSKKTEAY